MKRLFPFFLLISLIAVSCAPEPFNIIDPTDFNQKIADRTDIPNADELAKVYYNYPPEEGSPQFDIKSVEITEGTFETTFIHDGMMDDSQRAVKIIITSEQKDGKWEVLKIKKNFKCYEGRGHTDWGTEFCI